MVFHNTSGTADTVWIQWSSSTATNCGSTTDDRVWSKWTTNTSASTTGYVEAVWTRWNGIDGTITSGRTYRQSKMVQIPAEAYVPPAPTPEQLEAEKRRREEAERKLAAEKKAREAAEARAKELLLQLLNAEQQAQFKKDRTFRVVAGDGVTFRIKDGWAGNVEELNKDGKAVNRFCIHPQQDIPVGDNLIAQKLLLEADPKEFRRIANRTALAPV